MSGKTRDTTDDEPTSNYQTAREFFGYGDEPDLDRENPSLCVVWYDQATPLYLCSRHGSMLGPLKWEGDRMDVDDHDEIRKAAYERLHSRHPPECQACTDSLPKAVYKP